MERSRKIGPVSNLVLLPVKVISTMKGYDGEAALRDAGVLFHGTPADYSTLRFAELPIGWKVIEHGGSRWGVCNLLDNKNRVRATMRHTWRLSGPISMRPIGIQAIMKVACPFIISFRGEREDKLVARIRIRHGSEIKAMPATQVKAIKKRGSLGEMKAEKIAFMRQWLDEALPDWKMNSKYWDHQKAA